MKASSRLYRPLIVFLLVANLVLAIYVISRRASNLRRPVQLPTIAKTITGDKPYLPPSVLLSVFNALKAEGKLSELQRFSHRSSSGNAVVALFSSVCTGCSTGALVEMLKSSQRQYKDSTFAIVLPNTFSDADLKNFKTNLELAFVIERAGPDISRQWASLATEYGEQSINGTVVVLVEGEIANVAKGLEELGQTETMLKRLLEKSIE